MSIRKIIFKGCIRYQVRVRDCNGRWFPAKNFQRKVDAARYEESLLGQKSNGVKSPEKLVLHLTTSEYWKVWCDECRIETSTGWRTKQKQMFRDHIKPVIGQLKIGKITQRDIGKVLQRMVQKGLSGQTRAHVYNLMHSVFEDAIHHFEILQFNPVVKRLKPKVYKKERNFWKAETSWFVLEKVKDHWLGPAIWVGVLTGMRPGEIQALRWSQIDFENQRIVINATFSREEGDIQHYPKQKDWGEAPIPEVLKNYLMSLRMSFPDSEFICRCSNGKVLTYHSFYSTLKRICRDLGVKCITPHELRHSATDLYYEAGASTEDLRRLLNHSKAETTETYIHRTDERLRSVAQKIVMPWGVESSE